MIEKDGISLRGVKAVLEPPTEPKEGPCEGAGLCVLGDVDFQTGEVSEYVEDVSISGFTVRNFSVYGIVAIGARDSSFVKNRTFNAGEYGITSFFSTGTKVISNVTSGAEDAAIYVGDSPHANTKISITTPTIVPRASWFETPSMDGSPPTKPTTTAWG